MARKTIAVDIDDVLAANAEGFTKYSNEKWGTRLKPDDYDEHWAEMWGVDYEEEAKRRESLFEDKVFISYRFHDDSMPVLKKLSKRYKLVVVSARSNNIASDTTDWVKAYYKDLFSEIHYANIWNDLKLHTKDKVRLTKAETLDQIGADYLVDDQPKHCFAAADAGIKTVLFGDYRWNRDIKLRKNMVRARTWQEVLEYFDAESR